VHADTKIGKDASPARGREAPPGRLKWPEQLSHLDLSDAVRNDIHFEVDYHFYMSLKTSFCMSLTVFVKGILLPLVESPMPASAPSERAIIIIALQAYSRPSRRRSEFRSPRKLSVQWTGRLLPSGVAEQTAFRSPGIGSVVSCFASFLRRPTRVLPSSGSGSAVTGSRVDGTVLPVLWHPALLVIVLRHKERSPDQPARECIRSSSS
jgi:hypothetical protein